MINTKETFDCLGGVRREPIPAKDEALAAFLAKDSQWDAARAFFAFGSVMFFRSDLYDSIL